MEQCILPLVSSNIYQVDDFIVSSSNQVAYNTITQWPTQSWGVAPYKSCLLLYGPAASGKTHLTKIWQSAAQAISLQAGTLAAITMLTMHNAFIIEDIEHNWSEQDLYHYINFAHEHDKYLLLTTAQYTNNFKLPDLSSRINAIFKITLCQPDDDLLKILIFKYFANYSIKLSKPVLNFLLLRLPRKFDVIIRALEIIHNFSLLHKRNVTVPLIREIMQIYQFNNNSLIS